MSRPGGIVALLVVFLSASAIAAFPWVRRLHRQSELERTSADLCACMLGRHTGDIAASLAGVKLATDLDGSYKGEWPARCSKYADPAIEAMRAAWQSNVPGAVDGSWGEIATDIRNGKTDTAIEFLGGAQHFWVGEPASTVPVAPAPAFPRIDARTRPFFGHQAQVLDFAIEDFGADIGGCKVDNDLHVDCRQELSPHLHLDTGEVGSVGAIVSEQGAPQLFLDTTTRRVLKGDKTVLFSLPPATPDEIGGIDTGRAFANGRVVLFENDTMWDWKDGKLRKGKREIIEYQRSTQYIDPWVIWKDTSKGRLVDAEVRVLDLSLGLDGKPQSLGTIAKPKSFGAARTYGVCRAASTFVNLDPNLAVLHAGAWTMHTLDQPLHGRHMICDGDVAILTDFNPPEVRRCDARGCTSMKVPAVEGQADDEFASDGRTLYQLAARNRAYLLVIRSMDGGSTRTIPIGSTDDIQPAFGQQDFGMLHVFGARAILTVMRKTDDRFVVVAVDPDGTAHILASGD